MRKLSIILIICAILFFTVQSQKKKSNENKGVVSAIMDIFKGDFSGLIQIGWNMLTSKIFQIVTGIGSLFGVFKYYRKQKQRKDRISDYFGDEKTHFAEIAPEQQQKMGKQTIELMIYQLNEGGKKRMMDVKSSNEKHHFVTEIDIKEVEEESPMIYEIEMTGKDPTGQSTFLGFVSFKNKKMIMRLEKIEKKQSNDRQIPPIIYYSGDQDGNSIKGNWWVENQKNTKGDFSGTWIMNL